MATLAERIDKILPQTQCRQCGYYGCRPYADAIESGDADFNQCPPGGAAGIARLAALLGRPVRALNPANGIEQARMLARIDAARCIGCTLCIQACPVDAIIGAPGFLHAVIDESCTGCDLCIAPCPVDCIERVPAEPLQGPWDAGRAAAARSRHQQRTERLARQQAAADARLARHSRDAMDLTGNEAGAVSVDGTAQESLDPSLNESLNGSLSGSVNARVSQPGANPARSAGKSSAAQAAEAALARARARRQSRP